MAYVNPTTSIIMLNINGLNTPIKDRVDFLKKSKYIVSIKTDFKFKDINRLKIEGQKKIYYVNNNHRREEYVNCYQIK